MERGQVREGMKDGTEEREKGLWVCLELLNSTSFTVFKQVYSCEMHIKKKEGVRAQKKKV